MMAGIFIFSTTDLTDGLYQYTRLYGAQVLLLTILSAIAVYRREMSCNHVYVDDGECASATMERARTNEEDGRNQLSAAERGSPQRKTRICEKDRKMEDSSDSLLFLFPVIWSYLRLSLSSRVCDVEEPARKKKRVTATWDECADDILDGAGSFLCSPPRLMWSTAFGGLQVTMKQGLSVSAEKKTVKHNHITHGLAPDIHVHILSFLHPKDVVTFACASKDARMLVDHGQTSLNLWGALWKRDYSWLVESWCLGRAAFERSSQSPATTKDFYFRFGLSYTNFILAGHNTPESCLVAIHGSIYDLTTFLEQHPGTPDTLLVQSGKDVTKHFDDIGHSSSARKYARTLCVAVDNFAQCDTAEGSCCGVQPTKNTTLLSTSSSSRIEVAEPTNIPFQRRRHQKSRPSTLYTIRESFLKEQRLHQMTTDRTHAKNVHVLGNVNVFYDPFTRQWQLWYTDTDFKTVFESL